MSTLSIVTRPQWGARHGRGSTNITPSRGGCAGHYNGGPIARGPHALCAARVRSIEQFHALTRRWAGIAYNYLICHHGYVFEGRGWGRRSAAQGTNAGNQNYLAIMFLMGGSQSMTAEMRTAGRLLVLHLRSRGAGGQVRPHSFFTSTSCPGGSVRSWISLGAPGGGGASPGAGGARSTADVQRAVNGLGYRPPLAVDGINGPLTETGVRWLQARVGASVDGVWGSETERLYLAYVEDDFAMSERHWYSFFSPRDGDPQVIPPGEIRAIRFADSSNDQVSPSNRYATVCFSNRELLSATCGVRLESPEGAEPGEYYLFYGRTPEDAAADDVSRGTRFLGSESRRKRTRIGFTGETFSNGGDEARLRLYVHNYEDAPMYLTGAQFDSRQRTK